MKTIVQNVHNSNQSWYLDEILEIKGKRLHVEIRKNAYVIQSYGKIELWDGNKWNGVHSVPGELLKTSASYVQKGITCSSFQDDRAELLRVAKLVCFVNEE